MTRQTHARLRVGAVEPKNSQPPPGQEHLGPAVKAFDARCDELLGRVRGRRTADRMFATVTHLGDFSLIWHLIGIVRGIIRERPDQMMVLAIALGIESLVVNQGIKRIFRRHRPTASGDGRLPVRTPSTYSFPSGHASSASFAATILSRWDAIRSPWPRIWWSIAAVVGVSRAYVRIHHASDVMGGAVVGRVLGLIAWRIIRRLLPT